MRGVACSTQRTVTQCKSCPWRVDCVPDRDIPNGYSVKLHKSLRKTIATEATFRPSAELHAMACHYSKPGEEHHCAGWIHNQRGVGNNIAVRLAVIGGRMPVPEVVGEQHETFDATLPKRKRARP